MIRIYCKERPPVGIPVIEHLELNISPLMINLTNRFYRNMIKFFFLDGQTNVGNTATGGGAAGGGKLGMNSSMSSSSVASFQRATTLPKNSTAAFNLASSVNDDQHNAALININLGIITF